MQRIIQVGLGAMGQGWADCVAQSDKWEAAAYVDINRKNMTEAAERHGMPKNRCFRNLNTALRSVEADAVLDVTPQQTRPAVCTAALECGLDVLCEKPLADTLENAKALADLAQTTGRTLMVAQNYRYQPAVQTAKKFIAQGRLGKVGYAGVSFHKGPHFGGYREQMAYPLLLDMSIHHFDMMRCILGKDIEALAHQIVFHKEMGETLDGIATELIGIAAHVEKLVPSLSRERRGQPTGTPIGALKARRGCF